MPPVRHAVSQCQVSNRRRGPVRVDLCLKLGDLLGELSPLISHSLTGQHTFCEQRRQVVTALAQ